MNLQSMPRRGSATFHALYVPPATGAACQMYGTGYRSRAQHASTQSEQEQESRRAGEQESRRAGEEDDDEAEQ